MRHLFRRNRLMIAVMVICGVVCLTAVYTLREYYQSTNRWQAAGAYIPKFGDAAVYAKSPAQSHVNFVLSVDTNNQTMVTLGGNEEGHVKIKTKSYLPPHEDLVGFGMLE